GWTDALAALGAFSVFRSWWYRALLAVLALSIGACSIHRARTLWREAYHPHVRVGASMFERSAAVSADAEGAPTVAVAALLAALRRRGYRVLAEEREERTHVYADRHRLARFGTLVSHLSLVLLLVAAALGGTVRWSDVAFVVSEGSTRELGLDGLSVRLDSFAAEYYPTGEPKDYRSDIELYRSGAEVARKTVRVNDPLDYDGISFYQSFYGPAAALRVTDATGRLVYDDAVALTSTVQGERPAGTIALDGLTVYVIAPSVSGNGDDLIRPGEMRLEVYRSGASTPVAAQNIAQGTEAQLAGFRFGFVREDRFTGLRVARDPTAGLVWAASGLFVLGLTATFGLPYRRLWGRIDPHGAGSRVSLVTVGGQSTETADELARVAHEVSVAKE
ncbi:MAG TPA: cytochrome c biogenesis protein ResB, partial [Gaiellaceae bacterium]|nr:cytochrome c biogenesis protein ResB [Gaiellaceae bacterium]